MGWWGGVGSNLQETIGGWLQVHWCNKLAIPTHPLIKKYSTIILDFSRADSDVPYIVLPKAEQTKIALFNKLYSPSLFFIVILFALAVYLSSNW